MGVGLYLRGFSNPTRMCGLDLKIKVVFLLTGGGVDGVREVVKLDVNCGPLRLVRKSLHFGSGRDPGDWPVFGHAEHPRPTWVHQQHLFVVFFLQQLGATILATSLVVVLFVVDLNGRKRHGTLDTPTHRGRSVVFGHGFEKQCIVDVDRYNYFFGCRTFIKHCCKKERLIEKKKNYSWRSRGLRQYRRAHSIGRGSDRLRKEYTIRCGRWKAVRPNEPVASALVSCTYRAIIVIVHERSATAAAPPRLRSCFSIFYSTADLVHGEQMRYSLQSPVYRKNKTNTFDV